MDNIKVISRTKDSGNNKSLLKKDLIPGIIYGKGTKPTKISCDKKILNILTQSHAFYTNVLNIEIEGKAEKVLPKALQFHPVTDTLIHFDLLRVQKNTKVTVEVPVEFLNQDICPGLKQGGVLNYVRRGIELICNANNIPNVLKFDLSETEIGDSVKISSIELPEDIQLTIRDRDFVIATLAPPTKEEEEVKPEEEAEGATEGETPESEESEKTEDKKDENAESKEETKEKETEKK